MNTPTTYNLSDLLPDTPAARTATLIRRELFDAGFRPVPVRNAQQGDSKSGKAPKGQGWQREARADLPECVTWAEADADALSTGLLCDGLRVVDVDVDADTTADRVREAAERVLGPAVSIRTRQGTGRCALVYRAAEGMPLKLFRANSATGDKVEVLGCGQQLMAFGEHHTGQPIMWQGAPGLEVSRDDLPAVTEEQIEAFLAEAADIIQADPPRIHEPLFESHAAQIGDRDPLTEEDVRACLALLSDAGYENWRDIGAAIHDWDSGSTGFEVFHDWSKSGHYDGRSAVARQWNAFRGMRAIHQGSLVWRARQANPDFVLPSRRTDAIPALLVRNREKISQQVRESHERHAAHLEAEARKPKKRRFRMLRCREAANLPRPKYVIPGLMIENTIGAYYGPSGSLKSFLMIDIALSLAHGLPWRGHPLKQQPVFYVAAEGAHGLGVRIDAWKRRHGVADLDSNFILIPEGVNLMDAECIRDLTLEIAEMCAEMGVEPGLVVLDTLATCAVGMEENSGKETGIAIGAMSEMRHTLGCMVYAVHHTGKNAEAGMRGSYRLKGDLDCVIEVCRGDKDATPAMDRSMCVTAHVEKQKDGPDGLTLHFTAVPHEWFKPGEGIVSTLVIEPREEHVGASPQQYSKIMEMRVQAAEVMEMDTPISRNALCQAAGWAPGRIYGMLSEAFPAEGAEVASPKHGPVSIAMENNRLLMRKR